MKQIVIFFLIFSCGNSLAQDNRSSRLEKRASKKSEFLAGMYSEWNHMGGVRIDSIIVYRDSMLVNYYFNPVTSHIPIRSPWVSQLRQRLKNELGRKFRKYNIKLWLRNRLMEEFIPNAFRDSVLTADVKRFAEKYNGTQLVTRENRQYLKGLTGNHIALWPSHGYFFDQQLDRWQWQRARLWQTVEDIFPWSFTSAFLVPMLENAGSNVLLPRERDTQVNEVIVDNDISIGKSEFLLSGNVNWDTMQTGFVWLDTIYGSQNPFTEGTSVSVKFTRNDSVSALYVPDIPETGYYAVYVSYPKTSECISRVPYKVNHSGGSEYYFVNQCMGYGTWVYLGTFHFMQGRHSGYGSVIIEGKDLAGILSADAVKFGGGMGNIARKPGLNLISRQRSADDGSVRPTNIEGDTVEYNWKVSGKPRWMEGSRYYLQFSGMPDTITYSLNEGRNDYNDDYMSRPEWVNYLIGPSRKQYSDRYQFGLNIPIDLALAFHTDAGITAYDSIIGTLGIYSTIRNDGFFPDGRSKMASRDLTDIIQTQLVDDIRGLMNPKWTRRGLWDREYSEAWRPVVPSMLLELLSHQNLSDMKYGLDPRFKFFAARSIYKGILRYLSFEQRRDVVVQPLPPDHFAIELIEGRKIRLSWQPVKDPLEVSAIPDGYFVYQKIEDKGFSPGTFTERNNLVIELPEWDTLYSFCIAAVNEGGESLPGETLSVCLKPANNPVLIVNAFDRICAPAFFDQGEMAGIAWWEDEGVPYIRDLSFSGFQYNFDRKSEWLHDDSQGWGASHADLETTSVAGNTFAFPLVHGKAIRNSGHSFVSVSDEAFQSPEFHMDKYHMADIIFGEERGTESFMKDSGKDFRVFTRPMIQAISRFTDLGGNVMISGAYIGTDMVENGDSAAIQFAADVLHYIWRSNHATTSGGVLAIDYGRSAFPARVDFNTEFGPEIYRVEAPDAIEPAGNGAFRICRYESGSTSAGVAYHGVYKTVVLGFPFETIVSETDRNEVMKGVIEFFIK
jgi:hypothetical protein